MNYGVIKKSGLLFGVGVIDGVGFTKKKTLCGFCFVWHKAAVKL